MTDPSRSLAPAHAGAGGLALNTLAKETGVSNRTIYNDFRSHEQVLEAVGRELAIQLSEQILAVSEAVDSGAERLSIAVRTFMNKARTDPDWTRALITVVRYAEGMRSALATYLRADLQAGRRQGDFHYAHEEMAMSMVLSATHGRHEPAGGGRRSGARRPSRGGDGVAGVGGAAGGG